MIPNLFPTTKLILFGRCSIMLKQIHKDLPAFNEINVIAYITQINILHAALVRQKIDVVLVAIGSANDTVFYKKLIDLFPETKFLLITNDPFREDKKLHRLGGGIFEASYNASIDQLAREISSMKWMQSMEGLV